MVGATGAPALPAGSEGNLDLVQMLPAVLAAAGVDRAVGVVRIRAILSHPPTLPSLSDGSRRCGQPASNRSRQNRRHRPRGRMVCRNRGDAVMGAWFCTQVTIVPWRPGGDRG